MPDFFVPTPVSSQTATVSCSSSAATVTADSRRLPWRPDCAAAFLRGQVVAERFVEGTERIVRVGCSGLHAAPHPAAQQISQVLYGERVTVYDTQDMWSWGQCATDGYVGYLRTESLAPPPLAPLSHRLAVLRSPLFPEPDLKVPVYDFLSFTSPLTVVGEERGYLALAGGGWVFAGHTRPWDAVIEADILVTARHFLGLPYLWGGRSSLGVDCSGLVQLALAAANCPAPRDSDMQRAELGCAVAVAEAAPRDLLFFPGHVGILEEDGTTLLHATAFTQMVVHEPVTAVAARAGGLRAVRRLMPMALSTNLPKD